jgi:sterol desaturase/sphingolipid hydroxylase (fatty acid hydroxylase superfamily)
VHHFVFQPQTDSNYGAVFPIWDLVIKNFRVKIREKKREMRIRLEEVCEKRSYLLG